VGTTKVIAYSGANLKGVVETAVKNNARVQVLIQRPDRAISQLQQNLIESSIHEFEIHHDNIGINPALGLYAQPASISAVLVDHDLVAVGWYSYDRRHSVAEDQVQGRTNPYVVLRYGDQGFELLYQMVDTVFQDYYAKSEKYRDYIKRKVQRGPDGETMESRRYP
jgi:hypothetical protein